jgi:hypothetical protein
MKKISPILLALSLAVAGALPAASQDQPASASAPKYLQITVEYVKPGKGGMAHDKTEGAFVKAMAKAKFPIHYTAFNAITGRPRAIYLSSFDSFEEIEKANKVMAAPATAAEFERLNLADGELLADTKTLIFESVPELSFHSRRPGPENRYLQAQILLIRPGHNKDFEDLAKMVMAADEKAGMSAHWGAYRLRFGEESGTYVLLTSGKSLAELDQRISEQPKYLAALSDAEKKKLDELRAAAIESGHSELYVVNPVQSYVSEDFIKADPDFWKPKPMAAMPEKKATP